MIMFEVDEGFISEVRWTAGTERFGARVNFELTTSDGRVSLAITNATQADFTSLTGLQMKPVSVKSQMAVRRYNRDQYLELRSPMFRRLGAPAPAAAGEPVK